MKKVLTRGLVLAPSSFPTDRLKTALLLQFVFVHALVGSYVHCKTIPLILR